MKKQPHQNYDYIRHCNRKALLLKQMTPAQNRRMCGKNYAKYFPKFPKTFFSWHA